MSYTKQIVCINFTNVTKRFLGWGRMRSTRPISNFDGREFWGKNNGLLQKKQFVNLIRIYGIVENLWWCMQPFFGGHYACWKTFEEIIKNNKNNRICLLFWLWYMSICHGSGWFWKIWGRQNRWLFLLLFMEIKFPVANNMADMILGNL